MLYLEDNNNDAELVQRAPLSGGYDIALAESDEDFREALSTTSFDLIISDWPLPSFDGLTALFLVREECPNVPFIFLSGAIGADPPVESLFNGGIDYGVSGKISRLIPAME